MRNVIVVAKQDILVQIRR